MFVPPDHGCRSPKVVKLNDTSEKLIGKNYLLWTQSFETFIAVHRKLKHLSQPFPDAKDATYEDWYVDDATIVSWLVNSMESIVARGITMLCPVEKIWDTLKTTYGHKNNISRVFEVYE